MREVIGFILGRPVGVFVVCVALAVMGVLSFLNIPVQLLPEGFEQRHITVRATLRESSAQEAEQQVAVPLEEALGTVSGIESISSRCGRSEVSLSLDLKGDADPATVERDVRDRVARVEGDLPDDVMRLRVSRRGMSDMPVMFFACTAAIDPVALSDFMEEVLSPKVEALEGVARISSWGLVRRSVRIQLDQEEVARRRMDLRALLQRLRGDNLSADLGDVRDGGRKALVRASMDFDSLAEIRAFPVAEGLKLGDLERVRVLPSLDQGLSRYNGRPVIVGTIHKMAGANTVAVCARLRALFDELQGDPPAIRELVLKPFFDQGERIETSVATLYDNALYGGILAIAILFLFFRRLRMTLLVAVALPLSLTVAVTVLYLGGDSLNIASMMGLTLAVGMLIDNAIVVVESILRRREAGDAPRDAAARGTREVALAVLTATLTTIVVVAPAIWLSGDTDARRWLISIGGPIAYALLASLAVALVLVPLGSIYLRRKTDGTGPVRAAGLSIGARERFGNLLGGALRRRLAIVALGALLCISGGFPISRVSRRSAMGHGGRPVRVQIRFPRYYDLSDADRTVRRYEDYVKGILDRLELEGIYARFDRHMGMVMIWSRKDSNTPTDEVREEMRKGWPRIEGVWNSLETAGEEGRTTVTLEGEDTGELERAMDGIEARLKQLPQVAETTRERDSGIEELRVRVDPEASERALVVPDRVRGMVGWVVRGARLRDYRSRGRNLPLLLELDRQGQAVNVDDLRRLQVPTDAGLKPLSVLSRMEVRHAPASIERRDGRRVAEMQVLGNGGDEKEFHDQVQAVLSGIRLPPGVRFKLGGSWQRLQENFADLLQALAFGGVLVFLLTGILFEALLLPLAVLFAIPTALVGALWALYLTGKPLDELALLGCILLVGIVVNNGIVLIDRAQQWRRRGLPLRAAVRAAGRDRLRPVVMTALTTIAGLLPMALFRGSNESIPYDAMATAVIGGLLVSTLVTLLLVPVVYTLFADLGRAASLGLRRAGSILAGQRPNGA